MSSLHLFSFTLTCLPSLILAFILPSFAQSVVPPSNTFEIFNYLPFGDSLTNDFIKTPIEYGADYRGLPIGNFPFLFCFYNTTPNAFTLAIRMGLHGSNNPHDTRRWVWEANRGKPVQNGARLKFGSDGNLVLTDVDGQIAWQTFTSNKGVVKVELLDNGNLVLLDANGKYVWQSFFYPTDTLLLGQSLWARGVRKLVSRASDRVNINGPYSLVLEPTRLVMMYHSKKTRQPLVYYEFLDLRNRTRGAVTFKGSQYNYPFSQSLYLSTLFGWAANLVLAKYDSTFSFLRLGQDGNLRIVTLDRFAGIGAWDVAFSLFSNSSSLGSVIYYRLESQCQLPEKCGSYGICEDNQCVACPTPNGLQGWSKDWQPPKLTSCDDKDFRYYKIEGVDHFMCKYNQGMGPMKENECGDNCTNDCKCLGYFYHAEKSMCWIAYDLKTLTKTENKMHVAYIKTPNDQ